MRIGRSCGSLTRYAARMPSTAADRGWLSARGVGVLVVLSMAAGPVLAQDAPAPDERSPVKLRRLLELPSDLQYDAEQKGGHTRGEWRARFQDLRARLAHEEEQLEDAYAVREDVASSSDAWQVALPGGISASSGQDTPLDYQLSRRIKRHKAEIERLERALLDLEVEANLAGVPEEWRE